MSDAQKQAKKRAFRRLANVEATAIQLQGEVSDIAADLTAAGLDGERLMTETGMQLISVLEAAGQAKSAA